MSGDPSPQSRSGERPGDASQSRLAAKKRGAGLVRGSVSRYRAALSGGLFGLFGILVTAALLSGADASADAWAAAATWLTLVVALAAALVTVHQVVEGRRQRAEDDAQERLQRQQEMTHAIEIQSRQLRAQRELAEEAAQPLVVAIAELKSAASGDYAELVIRNVGQTPAYDVEVTFEPALLSGLIPEEGTRPLRTPSVFPVLAPGQEWRTLWDRLDRDLDDDAEWPTWSATVRFKRAGGRDPVGGPFVYELNLRSLVRGRLVEYGMHEAAGALRDIKKTIGTWRGLKGSQLKAQVRDGDAQDERDREAKAERERRLAERGPGPTTVPPDALDEHPPLEGLQSPEPSTNE